MARRLPPLNALRAFEAAARHLSFSRAAEELSVTQSAVSHQIKALEQRLKLALFRRRGRHLALTAEGHAYLPALREAFDRLALATDRLTRQRLDGRLNVSVLPSFAATWLLPRLKRFRARHPEIELSIQPELRLVDFARDEVDIAIRIGRGPYPGLDAQKLFGETLFPVCSPALRKGPPPIRRPADLARQTLLHDAGREDWAMWLAAAGVGGIDTARGPEFGNYDLVVLAAVGGQGVAIARSALVEEPLREGRLVRLFEPAIPGVFHYWVVCRPEDTARPRIAAFRRWLTEEAAAMPS
ncbi:MAG: transcriptional regulator GcvA [Alphaproteobacteria bacterium]|nr:transcriptional regulator GcvA [Alphaproteobacteria bacterium]